MKGYKAIERELAETRLELEIQKNRKIVKFIDWLKRGFDTVMPSRITESVHSRIVNLRRRRAAEIYDKLVEKSFSQKGYVASSQYDYPNLRLVSVASVPLLEGCAPVITLKDGWQNKLRPDITSTDAAVFELPKDSETAYPHALAKEVASAAKKANVPRVVICNTPDQLSSDVVSLCSLVAAGSDEVFEVARKKYEADKVVLLNPSVDISIFNPNGWKLEPRYGLQIIGQNPPSQDDLDRCRSLLYAGFADTDIFGPKQLTEHFSGRRVDDYTGFDPVIFQRSKYYEATLCLPSMFESRLVFYQAVLQLLACGTHVFTSDERIVKELKVPALHLLRDKKVDLSIIRGVENREKKSIVSRRKVMFGHSRRSRFNEIIRRAGINTDINRKVSVIMCTNRPDYIDLAIENVKKQSYTDVELVIVMHGGGFDYKSIEKSLKASGLQYKTVKCSAAAVFGECLNRGLDAASGYWITKFDDDDYYGSNHLKDIVIAYEFSGAQVVGKWAHLVYLKDSDTMLDYQTDKQEQYAGHLPGGTFLIARSLLLEFRFGRVRNAIDSELWRRIKEGGGSLYSTHRYNYVRVRHGENTWNEDDQFFIDKSTGKMSSQGPEVGFV